MTRKILFLDDKEAAHKAFRRQIAIHAPNSTVEFYKSAHLVEEKIRNETFDIFFLDQRLKDGEQGTMVAQKIIEQHPDAYIVMATGFGLESAVEAIRTKVFSDFISKSGDDEFEALDLVFKRFENFQAEKNKRLDAEEKARVHEDIANKALKQIRDYMSIITELQKELHIDICEYTDSSSKLKGNSEALHQVRWFINLYSKVDLPVLILGETGTGKELVAEEIHKKSSRSSSKLIIINCAAIPESLIESELFGVNAEAATGITKDREGAFKRAHKGTLFLDEFGDMSSLVQAKVLRAIEDGKILPVGGKKEIEVDVRVICATSLKLKEKAGKDFRIDLFYRVGGLFPEIPPLKKRKEDIIRIYQNYVLKQQIDHFLSQDALEALIADDYDWPGNVRELLKFFEHTTAIFPRTRFNRTLALKLLNLWITHQPVKGFTNKITEVEQNDKSIQKEEDIYIPDYMIQDLVMLLEKFLSIYEEIENAKNEKPTIREIEKIIKPENKTGWLTTHFSKIEKRKVIVAIDRNPRLNRLKEIHPIKKHFK